MLGHQDELQCFADLGKAEGALLMETEPARTGLARIGEDDEGRILELQDRAVACRPPEESRANQRQLREA